MFRNYLVVALRNAGRHRLYSFITIAGLMVALTCAIFIMLFVADELSYNAWIPGSQNVFRVDTTWHFPGFPAQHYALSPFPLAKALRDNVPEVSAATRLVNEHMTVKADNRKFVERVAFVDPNFFTVIHLPLLQGSPATAFSNPDSAVISVAMARKFFGTSSPIGKTLELKGTHPVTVTGTIAVAPHNTEFHNQIYVSNKSRVDSFPDKGEWFDPETYVYVRLVRGASPAAVQAQTPAIFRADADPSTLIKTKLTGDEILHAHLVPLTQTHLSGDQGEGATGDWGSVYGQGASVGGSWSVVYGFAAIAFLIIGIACFNFTNLATARAVARAREVSLRKVLGARRTQLITQFLAESVLTACVTLLLALAVVEVLMPSFAQFIGHPITLRLFTDWPLLLIILVVTVATGILAGLYPALVLSSFRPAGVLRGSGGIDSGSGLLRMGLVLLQFAVSIGLGIAAVVIFAQTQYARNVELGFSRNNIVAVDGAHHLGSGKLKLLEAQLRQGPNILAVSSSSAVPFGGLFQGTSVSLPGQPQNFSSRIMSIEPGFLQLYGIKLLAGRDLSKTRAADVINNVNSSDDVLPGRNVLINQTQARKLGLTPQLAIDKIVRIGTSQAAARIVGVVADARFYGALHPVAPTLYVDKPNQKYVLSVKVKGGHTAAAVAAIDRAWQEFAPNSAIRRHFLNDSFDRLFNGAEHEGQMFGVFVAIAIVIACLGLYGLAAFTAQRRTKEIGIRKVFGARKVDVVRLLLWQFSVPVLLANLIAWPIAWYYLSDWLEGFADRIWLNPGYFVSAGLVALAIAWTTVVSHALRAAARKPIQSLRYE